MKIAYILSVKGIVLNCLFFLNILVYVNLINYMDRFTLAGKNSDYT